MSINPLKNRCPYYSLLVSETFVGLRERPRWRMIDTRPKPFNEAQGL